MFPSCSDPTGSPIMAHVWGENELGLCWDSGLEEGTRWCLWLALERLYLAWRIWTQYLMFLSFQRTIVTLRPTRYWTESQRGLLPFLHHSRAAAFWSDAWSRNEVLWTRTFGLPVATQRGSLRSFEALPRLVSLHLLVKYLNPQQVPVWRGANPRRRRVQPIETAWTGNPWLSHHSS